MAGCQRARGESMRATYSNKLNWYYKCIKNTGNKNTRHQTKTERLTDKPRFFYANRFLCKVVFHQFLQGVSIAGYACPVVAIIGMSVCPSVSPSHAGIVSKRRKLGSRNLHQRIAQARTLVFAIKRSARNSKAFIQSEGVKWEWGRKNSQFSANKSPYLRNGTR